MLSIILLHTAISFTAAILTHFLNLPILILQNLHTYIHPDSLPNPNPNPNPNPRSKSQLLCLPLTNSLTPSRLFFPSYRSSFFSSFISLSNLSFSILFSLPFPVAILLISTSHLLISLLNLSLQRAASAPSHRRLSLLSALFSFLSAQSILTHFSPSLFDFRIPPPLSFAPSLLAGFLGGLLFTPTSRAARSFWLGTNQQRSNPIIVSCGTSGRLLLYASLILSFFSSMLWVRLRPFANARIFEDWRVCVLAASAVSQLLALRSNVQMYLNEPVLWWYQRLHSGGVPDLDCGRKKVFLHNHYVCIAVIQFLALPVLVLMLVGLSRVRGDLFGEFCFAEGLMDWSDVVKEMALFLAWWIMFVRSILMVLLLGVYRCGFTFVS